MKTYILKHESRFGTTVNVVKSKETHEDFELNDRNFDATEKEQLIIDNCNIEFEPHRGDIVSFTYVASKEQIVI